MAGYQRREDDTAVDVKTIRLLTTLYTNSLWMEVLEMESVTLKLATQYSVQKPALAVLICTILGETHLVTNGFAKAIILDERGLELYEGNGDMRGQMITLHRLGSYHKSLGNYKQAIVRFKNVRKFYVNYTASPIRKPLGEDFMEVVLASLGKCCTNVGQNHKAIETYKRCRKLAEGRTVGGWQWQNPVKTLVRHISRPDNSTQRWICFSRPMSLQRRRIAMGYQTSKHK